MDIHKLLITGERITLECKKAKNSVPNSLWETYSAFANTYGGIILLGIDEHTNEQNNKQRFEVVGVEDADKICKDIWNIANNHEKVSHNILKDEDVQVVNTEGKDVVIIRVPRADYSIRPIYINNNLSRGAFKRNHEGDYHCTEQEVRMMLRDANESGNDGLFLEYYTMDDIDIPTLESYRVMFRTLQPEHIWNGLEHKEFLRQLGGYTINRKDKSEGLTLAGLLMFGKGLPVRERFDNLRMDYIDKSHLVGDQRYSDRLTYDGMWENNLFNFMRLVMPKITRDLPKPFQMQGIVRVDDTLQHKAVREAVTNMVIHADFMLNGLIRIEKFDDRIVLTNPGLLKLPLDQIYRGGESKARNQRMQNMLRMIGFGENLGSGFPLILHAWDEKHWIKPELVEQPELMQVKLTLHIINEPVSDPVNGPDEPINDPINETNEPLNGPDEPINGPINETLTGRQKAILEMMKERPSITREELIESLGLSLATLKREIAALRANGFISREGSRKNGAWITCKPE